MNTFYTASPAAQTLFLGAVFLTLLLSTMAVFAAYGRRKARWLRYADFSLFLALFALLGHYVDVLDCMKSGEPYALRIPLPMWTLWCMTAVLLILLSMELWVLYRQSDREPGANSVKQALDMLPEAVCYFLPSGAVKLCNLQMYCLFRTLAQTDLQRESELTGALEECDERSGVICLSKERNTYLFPDGKVWRYVQDGVTAKDGVTYTESIFFDVTELHEKNMALKQQTKQLRKIARDIKELSNNVLVMTREKEILNYKTRLHSQMGAGLTAIRQSLLLGKDNSEITSSIELLRRATGLFRDDNENPLEKSEWAELVQDAAVIGVRIFLSGQLPREEEALRLSLMTVRECLTNAVRHADATELYVEAQMENVCVTISVTNNGKPPEGEIVPGGGLDNLRRQLRTAGGSIAILSAPLFKLTVTIPIEGRKAT